MLGGLGFVFVLSGTIARWDDAPAWYHVISVAMVMPYAWVGGRLAERRSGAVLAPGAEPAPVA